jgi:hypothetical protein
MLSGSSGGVDFFDIIGGRDLRVWLGQFHSVDDTQNFCNWGELKPVLSLVGMLFHISETI